MWTLQDRVAVDPAADLVRDLAEDVATRWVPDPLADGDLAEQVRAPGVDVSDLKLLSVPRVSGPPRSAVQLSGRALATMRAAVLPLRRRSESILNPAVCGYRIGAAGGVRYDQEYRRFKDMSSALAEQSPFVLSVDLKDFFGSVVRTRVQPRMHASFGDDWEPIDHLMAHLENLGHLGLPAGYGDSRLIANMILTVVDQEIDADFTRWVDDYRIAVGSERDGTRILGRMDSVLSELGLELNRDKTALCTSQDFIRTLGMSLDSVYHPGDEVGELVHAQLRQVYIRAVTEPNRRLLRFSLPRLAREDDDMALDYCLQGLLNSDVDSPRMADYISRFHDDHRVAAFLETALSSLEDWSLARVLPLVPLVRMKQGRDTLLELTQAGRASSVSELAVRGLALLGDERVVHAVTQPNLDSRVAIAACLDLDLSVPVHHADRAVPTMMAADRVGRFPLPTTETIL